MVNYLILFIAILNLSGENISKIGYSNITFVMPLQCSLYTGYSTAECQDNNGRTVSEGSHYIPGPDTCTLCVCDNSVAKWCKAVLCSPPQVYLFTLFSHCFLSLLLIYNNSVLRMFYGEG